MRRYMAMLMTALLAVLLVGCGASEKKAEQALEQALGGNVKVDIDDGNYTYEDQDGNKLKMGSSDWPTGAAADIIPKLNKGTIVSVASTDTSCIIMIQDLEKKEFDAYHQAVKDAGFTEDAFVVFDDENGTGYQAGAEGGKSIVLTYTAEEKTLQIMSGILEN